MSRSRYLVGFVAGFIAVLVFHQAALFVLVAAGVTGATVWSLEPTAPFGLPSVLSAALFGGLWGVLFVAAAPRFARGAGFWTYALLFGAVPLTLVAWFVVAPLKGLPLGFGFGWPGTLVGPIVNGAWGLGTGLLVRAASRGARTA